MDDEDEIPSPATGSPPVSPRSNGRITVTVAAAGPPLQNSLTLALPLKQPRNSGAREDCWSEGATAVLIEAWGERYLELSRGNLKQKHWKEVADMVSSREDYTKIPKTDVQCKNRIDTVKKKYKLEKSKSAAGGGRSKWPFFERLEHLIGPTAKISANAANSSNPSASSTYGVPVGIPVGVRSANQIDNKNKRQQQQQKVQNKNQKQKIQIQRRSPVEEEESEAEQDSADNFQTQTIGRKRPRTQWGLNSNAAPARGREKGKGNGVGDLTAAIVKFGEAYERAERLKVQQAVEMEKQRMKFGKEVELQRMQFFMKTHLEISQLKHGRKSNDHHGNNNNSDLE